MNQADIEMYKRFRKDPLYFIECMWGLKPQEKGQEFVKGKHITWQQAEIIKAVQSSLQGGKKRISIASGHGIGKSACLSWLIIWYLFTNKNAQVPCTAPTSEQMHDVLWKEISLWLKRLPKPIEELFDWTTGYIRVKEHPTTWFARAKTARKEAPEALAGVHGDYVMFAIDEASGVPEEIFNTAEGALTGENVIVLMISNPTRLNGYFYDSHHKDKHNWATFQFNSEDSPIVDNEFVNRIIEKHGQDSDEYRIRVQGLFPKEDAIDDKGYVPLVVEKDLKFCPIADFIGILLLGIDPAGEGNDSTIWVIRDNFKAQIVAREKISDSKSIAEKTLTLMDYYKIDPSNIWIDNFGVGANVAVELMAVGKRVNPINVGERPNDKETFLNARAELYWMLRKWLIAGGQLVGDLAKWEQLLTVRYKRNLSGKLQIMSKDEMRREGIKSPDIADALMLTFNHKIKNSVSQYIPKSLNGLKDIQPKKW